MKPRLIDSSDVRARCPNCDGAMSLFSHLDNNRQEYGVISIGGNHHFDGRNYSTIEWRLLRCSGCDQAGLAKIHKGNMPLSLESFHPRALPCSPIPDGVPNSISNEFREAELCISVEAWRGASALLRSTLEKTLGENGYLDGSLHDKIDNAAEDGVITAARKRKAHDDIRVLGNEVVHDEWRVVSEDEVHAALHYAQRILEDFYDDRESVEKILIKQKRIEAPTAAETTAVAE